jgi:hypothetical protein
MHSIVLPIREYEKWNENLFDLSSLLKSKLIFKYHRKKALEFPDDEKEDLRYKTKSEPLSVISYTPSKRDLKRAVVANAFIHESSLLSITFFTSVFMAIFSLKAALLLFFVITVPAVALKMHDLIRDYKCYIKFHTLGITLFIYKEAFVERYVHADIELDYEGFKKERRIFGTCLFPHGDFGFAVCIPERVIRENPEFHQALQNQLNKALKKAHLSVNRQFSEFFKNLLKF